MDPPNASTAPPPGSVVFMRGPVPVPLGGPRRGPAVGGAVARRGARVSLGPQPKTRLAQARALVDRLVAEGRVVYGQTTGDGSLKNPGISPQSTRQRQRKLFMSHAVGGGPPLPAELLRPRMSRPFTQL